MPPPLSSDPFADGDSFDDASQGQADAEGCFGGGAFWLNDWPNSVFSSAQAMVAVGMISLPSASWTRIEPAQRRSGQRLGAEAWLECLMGVGLRTAQAAAPLQTQGQR